MRRKYITTQLLLACKKKRHEQLDIHSRIGETIRERKKLIETWEHSFFGRPADKVSTEITEAKRNDFIKTLLEVIHTGQNSNEKKAA